MNRNKWLGGTTAIAVAAGLAGYVAERQDTDDKINRPAPKVLKLVCPSVPHQLANDAESGPHRINSRVSVALKNQGGGVVAATVAEDRLTSPGSLESDPKVSTYYIQDFGQLDYADQWGRQYRIDVAQPPAKSLEVDPQAADVYICSER